MPAALFHHRFHDAPCAGAVERMIGPGGAVVAGRLHETGRGEINRTVGTEQRQQKVGGIFLCRSRELVHEAANCEAMMDGVHTAIPPDARVCRGRTDLHLHVGHMPRDVAGAVGEFVGFRALHIRRERGTDGRIRRSMMPRDDGAAGIEAGFQTMCGR